MDFTNIYSGYLKASAYNPVDKEVLGRALKPYAMTMKSASGLSDYQIRSKAIAAVLKKYRDGLKK